MVSRRRRRLEAQDDDVVGTEEPDRCPHCGEDAIVWDASQPKTGTRPDLDVMPICLACGRPVDLSPPVHSTGSCFTCGTTVVWEMRDGVGLVPVCAVHGPTQTYEPAQPQRESHSASFATPGAEMETPRRRGLMPSQVIGAVRVSRSSKPRYEAPLDPRDFGGR
jgi:hypothetical protein